MISVTRFRAVLAARNREFLRDRSALIWNILLPALIVFGFAFAFSGEPPSLYKVGVYGKTQDRAAAAFTRTEHIDFIPVARRNVAITKVRRHQLDMLIDPRARRYWVNDESPKGYMLERVLAGTQPDSLERQQVTGRPVRYVDWLIPGVLGMNMMFSSLFGVGYVIVRYRKNGVLKRLKATPLSAFEFLAAQVVSRLWLIIAITVLVFTGTHLVIGFTMYGNYLTLLLVFVLGAVCMISLGLLVAARTASEELAGGLLNIVSWPMMGLSGVWFSLEGMHPLLKQLALIFPLTHVTIAARAIMLDGAGLTAITPQLTALALMSVAFLIMGSYWFRWE
ncbi:MAG: ABC transporter permease [Gammaproteobacteria bacterium]|nr:ABC transporter permease [Gammaproteobacteria bacterium]MBA3731678.1 ABC transporter permease [Gammaproteobacteria bacterium]